MFLQVRLLTPEARIPQKGTDLSAGYDIFCTEDVVLPPGSRKLVSTGVSIALPRGHYGQLASRSGLAATQGLIVLGGVIDEDYRGEIKVILYNSSADKQVILTTGSRIAQLLIIPCANPMISMVDSLEATSRGEGGFGSTGQ